MKYNYNYIIVNLLNGKYYIGKHSTDNLNDGYMGSGYAIRKAINKYGQENFIKLIINHCETAEEAYLYEKLMIKEWMVLSDLCYNLRGGGDGPVFSEETKLKMSIKAKQRMAIPAEREKISEGTKKAMAANKEVSYKIAEANRRRKWKDESRNKTSSTLKQNYASFSPEWYDKKHEAQNKKYKWLTPDGNIEYMTKCGAHRWHPDWKLIE